MATSVARRLVGRRWMCSGSAYNRNIITCAKPLGIPTSISLAKSSAFLLRGTTICCASSFPSPPEDPLGSALLDLVTYEAVSSDTLESLCEYFDRLVETAPHLKNADITFSVRIVFAY